MAGHSKWANIKHESRQDAKEERYIKLIHDTVAESRWR